MNIKSLRHYDNQLIISNLYDCKYKSHISHLHVFLRVIPFYFGAKQQWVISSMIPSHYVAYQIFSFAILLFILIQSMCHARCE